MLFSLFNSGEAVRLTSHYYLGQGMGNKAIKGTEKGGGEGLLNSFKLETTTSTPAFSSSLATHYPCRLLLCILIPHYDNLEREQRRELD